MGIDHGGTDVLMSEEFLDGANVVAFFEEVGRERMAEGMAAAVLGNAGLADRVCNGALEGAFVCMVAIFSAGRFDPAAFS